MSIKEKPLIDAVERLGPLPAFFFAHPIIAGFFAMLMCPVFGAVILMFWGGLFGTAPEAYEAARLGAIIVTAFGSMVFLGIFLNAFRDPDETANRLLFVFGGALCLLLLIIFDRLTVDFLRAYFAEAGPLVCGAHMARCG